MTLAGSEREPSQFDQFKNTIDKRASRLGRAGCGSMWGVEREEAWSMPISALILRLCKAIPKPSILCPTVVEMFS